MNKFVGFISKFTCFSFAVALISVASASIAVGIGVFLMYSVMGTSYLEIFKTLLVELTVLVGLAGVIHFFLFGIIRSFHLKCLRPLNQTIIGYDFAPGITTEHLKQIISEIKKFPLVNTLTAISLSFSVVLAISFLAYKKTGDYAICLNAMLSGGLAVLLYATFTFIFTAAIIDGLRQKAYFLYRSYARSKRW